MMNGNKLYKSIPPIRRTRDYHLYDFRGRRYLDMFLDGGRALLGHKPGRTVLMMKNALEKGLSAAYPGIYPARLLKQLRLVYPQIEACSVVFAGRTYDTGAGEPPVVFRPFESEALPEDGLFELLLPLPGSGPFTVLCSGRAYDGSLPVSDAVPPFILSGLCRAGAELAAFMDNADESVWKSFDSPLWTRRGPWLYPAVNEDLYPEVFKALLERGILISPDYKLPSCAPYRFTEGEIRPIKEVEKELC